MADYATATELQGLILDQLNKTHGLKEDFLEEEAEEAYKTATQECGFIFPDLSDSDYGIKVLWLKERMRRWFMAAMWDQRVTRFDVSDMKASQMVAGLQKRVEHLDKTFNEAKESKTTAHIFLESTDMYGSGLLVVGPGFEDYRTGIAIEERS